jgi:PAS domain-containing protein
VGEFVLRELDFQGVAPIGGAAPDFRALFESAPGLYLVLAPDFTIVAASDAWCVATLTGREHVVGRNLFDVLLDGSEGTAATPAGIGDLRHSLMAVLEHRSHHRMAIQRCEVEGEGGGIEEHYWTATNTPVVDEDGTLRWIIHSFEDLTDTIRACRDEVGRQSSAATRALEPAHA